MNLIFAGVVNALIVVGIAWDGFKKVVLPDVPSPPVKDAEDDLGYHFADCQAVLANGLPMGEYDLPSEYQWDEFEAWVNAHD